MKKLLFGVILLSGCANQPTPETIKADLERVQADIKTIAANANPAIKVATTVANITETAMGNPELIPLTNAVSAAVQAANAAVAAKAANGN